MSFRVHRTEQNNTTLIHLSDNNHSTVVTIIPSAGALLHEFIVPVNNEPFNVIDNYQLNRPVNEQVTDYFKSVKLSPWVCRLNEGRYTFNGVTYQSEKMYSDGTALHGLLFDQPFKVESQYVNEDVASVLLVHEYKGYDPGFPFHYTCRVRYSLHAVNLLRIETTIVNRSNKEMPVADGWHPYFKLGGKVDGWRMFFPAKAKLAFNQRLIPTGELLPFDEFSGKGATIGNIEMDNCFLLEETTQPACMVYNPENNVAVLLHAARDYPFLQVFTPGHRQSIAIENLTSAPDSFNNGIGLLNLQPGQSTSFDVFYQVKVQQID